MIQSPITLRAIVVLSVSACAAPESLDVCLAQSAGNEEAVLPLSPALAPVPGDMRHEDRRTTVTWKGHDYSCGEGARVLMELVVDRDTNRSLRTEALHTLRRVPHRHLRDADTIEQLMSVYDSLHDRQEKVDLIALVGAWSPRSLPFLARILDREKDKGARQLAGAALAGWNVRSGVAELIRVLEECKEDASRDRSVCNEAGKEFTWLNARKGWGFPEGRIREEILSRADLSNEEMSALFVSEIKKWFTEDEHRFPDWKPGDPLPEVPQEEGKKAGQE